MSALNVSIYICVCRVLYMAEGRVAYHGPANEIAEFFNKLVIIFRIVLWEFVFTSCILSYTNKLNILLTIIHGSPRVERDWEPRRKTNIVYHWYHLYGWCQEVCCLFSILSIDIELPNSALLLLRSPSGRLLNLLWQLGKNSSIGRNSDE